MARSISECEEQMPARDTTQRQLEFNELAESWLIVATEHHGMRNCDTVFT